MFNIKNIPFIKKQQEKQTRKVVFFSFVSAGIAGIAGFLSHKDHRNQVANGLNKAGTQLKDLGEKTSKEVQTATQEMANKAGEMSNKATQEMAKAGENALKETERFGREVSDKIKEGFGNKDNNTTNSARVVEVKETTPIPTREDYKK